jgi:hypothetical protein
MVQLYPSHLLHKDWFITVSYIIINNLVTNEHLSMFDFLTPALDQLHVKHAREKKLCLNYKEHKYHGSAPGDNMKSPNHKAINKQIQLSTERFLTIENITRYKKPVFNRQS